MTTTTIGLRAELNQPRELRWLSFADRAVILRSAIVAVVIGTVLTLITQLDWVIGNAPLQRLSFVLAFVTPFLVVAISQVVANRKAFADKTRHHVSTGREGFLATSISHGIPVRAFAIALIIGSVNTAIIVAISLVRTGNLAEVPVSLLGQVFALPLFFGVMSQAISYRRAVRMKHRQSDQM